MITPESDASTDLDADAARVQSRIQTVTTRAVQLYCSRTLPPVKQAVLHAFLYVQCKRRAEFLDAVFQNNDILSLEQTDPGSILHQLYTLENLLVYPPARWDFEHVDVFGGISDAFSCADRYCTCANFITVHPLLPDDPLIGDDPYRCLLRHKHSSPWYQKFRRRNELRHQLGRQFKPLVNDARQMTKTEFLADFYKKPKPREQLERIEYPTKDPNRPIVRYHDSDWHAKHITHIEPDELLRRTGYAPDEFWREVQRPNTITPHRPQLELF